MDITQDTAIKAMQTLLLIRHGESEWNRDGRVQGYKNSGLSELGVMQAKRMRKRLRDESIDHIVSSTAGRALETCRYAVGTKADVEMCERLREINLGIWEGKKITYLRRKYPKEVATWYSSPSRLRIEGGETMLAFRRRIVREVTRIRREHPDETIAVFTHGGVICSYLTYLLGLPLDDMWSFKIKNGALTRVIFPNNRPRIELLGCVDYLEGIDVGARKASTRIFP
jgi:broad specificity phosphatase PhoE